MKGILRFNAFIASAFFTTIFVGLIYTIANTTGDNFIPPYFAYLLITVFIFIASYSLIVIESIVESHKKVIGDQRKEIEHLELLLLKREDNS